MNQLIKVTGTGKLSVPPDQIVLSIELEIVKPTYEKSVSLTERVYNDAVSRITNCGIEPEDVKTIRYAINQKFEYLGEDNKRVFVGYQTTHRLKLALPLDHARLAGIIKDLNALEVAPEISMRYSIQDSEAKKNELLKNAVRDSQTKATVLVEALDCKLGKVVAIDYSWGEIDIYSLTDNTWLFCDISPTPTGGDAGYDFVPDDINLEETVTVAWSIA